MGEVVFAVPVKPGGAETLSQLGEILREQLWERFMATRRDMGVRRIRWWLQRNHDGADLLIFFLEADDPKATLASLTEATSGMNQLLSKYTVQAVGFDPRVDPPEVVELIAFDALPQHIE